ncbi:MAG: hypothetical protein HYZ74_01225 [Elusimicrobia bacterium]|nr:hypothetical protein [Elusimicrobiota bacterium]
MNFRTALLALALAFPASRPARALEAAAAKIDITPDLRSEKVLLAGYGPIGRRARGVHDRLHARLLVLRSGGTVVALASLEVLGVSRNDVLDLRHLSGFDAPGKSLFVSAVHTHSGPDTLGLWGPFPGVSGVNRAYHLRIKREIALALKILEGQLQAVKAYGGRTLLDPRGLCRDSRDPQILDPNLALLRLKRSDGETLATVVNWSCHPTVLGWDNRLLSADFPGPLCARVESAAGGTCLFLNGLIGGHPVADSKEATFEEVARIGEAVAEAALRMRATNGGETLSYRSETVRIPVENSRYRLFLPVLAFGHRLFGADGRPLRSWEKWTLALRHALVGLSERTQPWVESEVAVLDVGPARLLGIPGEAFPELAIGGFDGRYSFGRPLIAPDNPAAPDLSKAPRGPYLRDRVRAPVPMLVGLANDELGYLVPGYDFKVRANRLMLPRLPGHYDETNSIGPSATRILIESAERLLQPPSSTVNR